MSKNISTIIGIIFILSLFMFYITTVKRLSESEPEQVVPPLAVVPLDYDSDTPAGHTGEPASPDQPQPTFPPIVVPPTCDCDSPVGHIGEAPGADQPSPVYPPDPATRPITVPEKPSEGLSKTKVQTKVQRHRPRVVRRVIRNLKRRVDSRRKVVYTGKTNRAVRVPMRPSPFYPAKYWKQ
jgi:hypothetical protein